MVFDFLMKEMIEFLFMNLYSQFLNFDELTLPWSGHCHPGRAVQPDGVCVPLREEHREGVGQVQQHRARRLREDRRRL